MSVGLSVILIYFRDLFRSLGREVGIVLGVGHIWFCVCPHMFNLIIIIIIIIIIICQSNVPVWSETFRTRPDRPWGPANFLYDGYRIFPGGKAAGA
jgi:hypothetical protein